MKISYNLLKQYIATDLTPPQIAELLTDGGLEVESIETFESVKGGLKNLVVGEVLTCEKHPDADKLKLTTVNVGNETPLNIVCGAPNVAKGQKVIIALIGAKLYPAQGEPFEIKKSKIRGAVSEGMICAEDEIGLGTSHEGIIILPEQTPIGMLAANYFNITNDFIFEIGLTPNRTDAISHIGVARDLSALLKQRLNIVAPIQKPAFSLSFNTSQPCPIDVTVQDVELCPRYSGIYLQDVQIAESPAWLKNTLASIGLRSINNVVDITNFVMHECGQPLHAFDADKIVGKKIIVSKANEGHKFTTLDSNEHTLKANYLMINNGSESMCIAGVFGGLHSGVTENTKSIFIESAYFNAGSVRKTARELQLKTDSSFRFERGTDPNITLWALQRAASLIIEITGAKAIGNLVDLYPTPIKNATLAVNPQRICNYIGKQISVETIENILTSLEINVVRKSDNELQLEIPTFKTDVTNEADIVEEVMRIYGFNNIEIPAKINASVNYIQRPQPDAVQNYISNRLSSLGFNEMMALSLTKDQLNQITKTYEEDKAIKLLNPISNEVNILRQHLLTGALQAVAYNINRKQKNLKFYEFGKVYFKNENSYKEEKHLSITISGQTSENNWQNLNKPSNFYFIKETFVSILNSLGI
ncbi:MAG: phenylalanine--tRNA ligase subunit beta, partial [Bacteroidia bacterium]|nr:phenylalanine--tRNA ligase subunit beta [Bacteroidia bacterium]